MRKFRRRRDVPPAAVEPALLVESESPAVPAAVRKPAAPGLEPLSNQNLTWVLHPITGERVYTALHAAPRYTDSEYRRGERERKEQRRRDRFVWSPSEL